jgi:hypothetical protein
VPEKFFISAVFYIAYLRHAGTQGFYVVTHILCLTAHTVAGISDVWGYTNKGNDGVDGTIWMEALIT